MAEKVVALTPRDAAALSLAAMTEADPKSGAYGAQYMAAMNAMIARMAAEQKSAESVVEAPAQFSAISSGRYTGDVFKPALIDQFDKNLPAQTWAARALLSAGLNTQDASKLAGATQFYNPSISNPDWGPKTVDNLTIGQEPYSHKHGFLPNKEPTIPQVVLAPQQYEQLLSKIVAADPNQSRDPMVQQRAAQMYQARMEELAQKALETTLAKPKYTYNSVLDNLPGLTGAPVQQQAPSNLRTLLDGVMNMLVTPAYAKEEGQTPATPRQPGDPEVSKLSSTSGFTNAELATMPMDLRLSNGFSAFASPLAGSPAPQQMSLKDQFIGQYGSSKPAPALPTKTRMEMANAAQGTVPPDRTLVDSSFGGMLPTYQFPDGRRTFNPPAETQRPLGTASMTKQKDVEASIAAYKAAAPAKPAVTRSVKVEDIFRPSIQANPPPGSSAAEKAAVAAKKIGSVVQKAPSALFGGISDLANAIKVPKLPLDAFSLFAPKVPTEVVAKVPEPGQEPLDPVADIAPRVVKKAPVKRAPVVQLLPAPIEVKPRPVFTLPPPPPPSVTPASIGFAPNFGLQANGSFIGSGGGILDTNSQRGFTLASQDSARAGALGLTGLMGGFGSNAAWGAANPGLANPLAAGGVVAQALGPSNGLMSMLSALTGVGGNSGGNAGSGPAAASGGGMRSISDRSTGNRNH
jgi:hypothetical protein